jgi:hypothetical protein
MATSTTKLYSDMSPNDKAALKELKVEIEAKFAAKNQEAPKLADMILAVSPGEATPDVMVGL